MAVMRRDGRSSGWKFDGDQPMNCEIDRFVIRLSRSSRSAHLLTYWFLKQAGGGGGGGGVREGGSGG